MTQPSWRGGEMVDQSHLSHPVLYKWESEGGGPRGRRRRRVAFRRLQFRYSPVDYRPDGVRPTEKGNPLEDANSTTDKLARRHDDTCKMGRQEAGPIPLSLPLPPSLCLRIWRRESQFSYRSTDWTIALGIVTVYPGLIFEWRERMPSISTGKTYSRLFPKAASNDIYCIITGIN